MKLKQISVFLENRPGHLNQICGVLKEANINLVTLTLADTSEFGLLRLIVREWEKARAVLENAGYAVNVTEVIAIEVPNEPGGLHRILQVASKGRLTVEYMYAFTFGRNGNTQIVFRFSNMERAAEVLTSAGINVLSAVEFYEENSLGNCS
ncbi:MAG: amino acid-binding protein [Deltaproteobacteria bacterium]|nr:amino acid-binding protein [Deltaproteobacteria bacterium]